MFGVFRHGFAQRRPFGMAGQFFVIDHGQCLQLPGLDVVGHAEQPHGRYVGMPAQYGGDDLAFALERHHIELRAQNRRHDARNAGRPGRCDLDFARFLAGFLDQVIDRLPAAVRLGHDDRHAPRQQDDGIEIGKAERRYAHDPIGGQILGRHQDGVAIRLFTLRLFRANRAIAPGGVPDHDRLFQMRLRQRRDGARHDVGRAARCERHNGGNLPFRILGRIHRRQAPRHQRRERKQQRQSSDHLFHVIPYIKRFETMATIEMLVAARTDSFVHAEVCTEKTVSCVSCMRIELTELRPDPATPLSAPDNRNAPEAPAPRRRLWPDRWQRPCP